MNLYLEMKIFFFYHFGVPYFAFIDKISNIYIVTEPPQWLDARESLLRISLNSPRRVHIIDLRQLFLQVSDEGVQLADEPEKIQTISHPWLVDGEKTFLLQ